MIKNPYILIAILLPACFACGPGRIDQAGQQAGAVQDTAAPEPEAAGPIQKPRCQAQKMWDTSDSAGFDVEEVNRKRAEQEAARIEEQKRQQELAQAPPPPLTREDTIEMLINIRPDSNGAFSYLKPSEFPGLPERISVWLEERNYVIPQIVPPVFQYIEQDSTPVNAIKGEFVRPGQIDWAVYCTNVIETRIFIFLEAATDSIIAVAKNEKTTDELDCCNDWINKISPETLVEYDSLLQLEHGSITPEMDHEGIAIGSYDYGDYSIYLHSGQWYVFISKDDE